MATAKQDFERFVGWLHQPEKQTPSDVRRLANLALANFDTLAATSRNRSQRSVYLVDLAREALEQTSDTAPVIEDVTANGAWPWKRLRHLTLGPFRGFRIPEPFDLQKPIVLFYGPNGSGKTSLCEGLEYALLGAVEEAGSKRIDARTYLTNVHAQRFVPPILKATDHQNREVDVVSNAETYRFCFIEKNRIDAFSRIAAKPAGQRSELIATLFGMDQFNEFVGHFNETVDRQLVLEADKQVVLTARRAALASDQATVDGEAKALQDLVSEETQLAQTHSAEMTYAGLKQLLGSAEAPDRLQELEGILNAVPPATIGLTRPDLLQAFEKAHKLSGQVAEVSAALAVRSSQVSFKELYTSVVALQEAEGDHCPACDTPLEGLVHVVTNPYEKAKVGLEQLKDLGDLQESLKIRQAEAATASRELRQQLADMGKFIAAQQEENTPVGRYLADLAVEPTGDWWTNLYPAQLDSNPEAFVLEHILVVADRVSAQDAASLLAQQERQKHIEERDNLNRLQFLVQAQDLKRQQYVDGIAEARARIAAFDVANAELIEQVVQEKHNIERDAPIKAAYDCFLTKLRDYRDQLPGSLLAGLNETAMNLYNEFNRNDLDVDKLVALHLPLTGEEKIEIIFRGNPPFDVSIVLAFAVPQEYPSESSVGSRSIQGVWGRGRP